MKQTTKQCPVCGSPYPLNELFCNQCGWEFRFFETPITGKFLEHEQQRLAIAQRVWEQHQEKLHHPVAYSYGFLVSYKGEECVSNMILFDETTEIRREWPIGKFTTQYEGQSSISIPIYRNRSNQKIVPLKEAEKVRTAVIALGEGVPKGTPIQVVWERDRNQSIQIKVTCLQKETIIFI